MWVAPSRSCSADGAPDTPRPDMDHLIPTLLLCLSALVSAHEPLAGVMLRRRNAYPVYAKDFEDEYEPYAVATIPVQAPLPIFQLISPAAYTGKLRKPVKRPQPNRELHAYAASSHIEQAYQPQTYQPQVYQPQAYQPQVYQPQAYQPQVYQPYAYNKPYAYNQQYAYNQVYEESQPQKYKVSPYNEEASSAVVYARPNKSGGYTYRKQPAPAPTPAPPAQQEPVIIRIHKYRVIH